MTWVHGHKVLYFIEFKFARKNYRKWEKMDTNGIKGGAMGIFKHNDESTIEYKPSSEN